MSLWSVLWFAQMSYQSHSSTSCILEIAGSLVTPKMLRTMFEPQSKKSPGLSLMEAQWGAAGGGCLGGYCAEVRCERPSVERAGWIFSEECTANKRIVNICQGNTLILIDKILGSPLCHMLKEHFGTWHHTSKNDLGWKILIFN